MKSPAFQWYPSAYLGSQRVQMMTLEEEGAYIRLLCYCWQHGSIPRDPEQAARLIGKGASTTLTTVVLSMFTPSADNGSRLVHDRLELERKKQVNWSEKSAEGGRNSAKARAKASIKGGSKMVEPPYQPNGNSVSVSLDYSHIILAAWNAASPPLPKCLTLSPKRKAAIAVRIKDQFFTENYAAAITKAASSDFLLGKTDRGTWRMDFDFFLKPDSVAKIIEGKYDNPAGSTRRERVGPMVVPQAHSDDLL